MNVDQIISLLERLAPLEYAADWDNVGLLIGSRRWPVTKIMLTIDLTEAVLKEAISSEAEMIIAYHPPIFAPIKSITDSTDRSQIILEVARAGVAVYCPHTALDAAPGGVSDWLAEGLIGKSGGGGGGGGGDVRALETIESLPESEQCKIVTFCPIDAAERIRHGLASAGAGRIGDYQLCSFEIRGTGTFLGGEGTKPVVGKRGALERVDETRLEMVCSKAALALAVMTLRQFHPYEEPPIEIYELMRRPQRYIGQGRRIVLDQAASLKSLTERIKKCLGVNQLQVALGDDAPAKYQTVGLCAGAGGSLLDAAIAQGCQLFFTGEMRHHDVLAAQARGCTIILAGHTNTERGYLKTLRKKLIPQLPETAIFISKRDVDPLQAM